MNKKHVAKQNFEEPCAVMSARTDLRESRESNPPRPPGKIKLDYHSSEPLYWQAVLEIKRLVVTKQLKPGDKLPSVRTLAEQLQLNATTIRRIFDQLAKEGIVVQRHGSGVFITDAELPFSLEYIQKLMNRQAVVYLVEGLRLGLDFDELNKILEGQYRQLMQEE